MSLVRSNNYQRERFRLNADEITVHHVRSQNPFENRCRSMLAMNISPTMQTIFSKLCTDKNEKPNIGQYT